MNPSPTVGGRFAAKVVGGGVLDAPRRGQDPSLQTNLKGGYVGRPAPRPPRELVGGCPGTGGHARLVKAPQASQARPVLRTRTPLSLRDISPRSGESPHCVGRHLRGRSPREKPPHQGRWPRSWPEGFSPLTVGIAKPRAGHARPLRTAVNRRAREGQGRAAARPFLQVSGWWTHSPSEPFRPRKLGQLP